MNPAADAEAGTGTTSMAGPEAVATTGRVAGAAPTAGRGPSAGAEAGRSSEAGAAAVGAGDGVAAGPVSELIVRAERWAREQPATIACRTGGRAPAATTYAQMARLVDRAMAALAQAGLRPGMRAALLVPPGPELGALALALLKLRAVPVLVDPGLPLTEIGRCLGRAAPEAFIAIPAAHAARRLLGWCRRSVRVTITVSGPWPRDGRGATSRRTTGTPPPWPPPGPGDLALIAFTSGATGPPKGVPLRHRHLAAQLELLGALGTVEPGAVVLSTFVPFALAAAAFGATVVLPDIDPRHPARADPAALAADIRRHRVAGMFAAPALLDRLARHCTARGLVLDTLDDVVVAGAPLPMPVLDRVRRCLRPDARVLSVYGATECMPVAAIDGRELAATAAATAAGAGTCLGLPLPGTRVSVIATSDEPIERWSADLAVPTGTVGEIVVASPAVADPYLDDPEASASARIHDGDVVWHRMGDLGRFDERGRLWCAGRKSERVRTAGGDLYPDQVEPVFATVPGVRRTALVGVGPDGARCPVLIVECEPGTSRRGRARAEAGILRLAARHPHTAGIGEVLFHRGFPVDARHNSKIRRNLLATWAARRVKGGRW
ncbi:fatty acid CoA ligase family protein [Sphaerisporangium melleum]|uniref:fatty acid CoA ligase family protein n=1 Tax=Sphaerisporangium melleum TaxID=321316 RepID=UPI001662C6AC|nr:fatty acid CoA ligase family protein [Sphaerisporangium melleum]